jgi:hypothetical protein
MQKKTELQNKSQGKVSAKRKSGLIVAAKKPTHSAGTECAVDNRSHRTKTDKEVVFRISV